MVEIVDLLFYQILKLNPSQVSGDFQSDFIYLLLIPTIIIILILQGLPKIFGVTNKGLRTLISIGGLAIIIERGWYGTLASLGTTFFIIGLVLAIISTFWLKIFKKEHAAGALKAGGLIRSQYTGRALASYLPSNRRDAINEMIKLGTIYTNNEKLLDHVKKLEGSTKGSEEEKEYSTKAAELSNQMSTAVAKASRIIETFGKDGKIIKAAGGDLRKVLKDRGVIK